MNKSGPLGKQIFRWSIWAKQTMLDWNIPGTSLIDSIAFVAVREATGGNLRLGMSGGGPLGRATQLFVSSTIAPLIQGYGLTETCGMGILNDPLAWTATGLLLREYFPRAGED